MLPSELIIAQSLVFSSALASDKKVLLIQYFTFSQGNEPLASAVPYSTLCVMQISNCWRSQRPKLYTCSTVQGASTQLQTQLQHKNKITT